MSSTAVGAVTKRAPKERRKPKKTLNAYVSGDALSVEAIVNNIPAVEDAELGRLSAQVLHRVKIVNLRG
jgi:hypothetical protein